MRARDLFSPGFLFYLAVALILYLPILALIVFSFNDSRLLVFPLKGFTLKWYQALFETAPLLEALGHSLVVGLLASASATALGALAGIALARYDFPGRNLFLAAASLPLVIPYVVLAVGMLLLFQVLGVPLSLWTVGLGHVVINIPYVTLVVMARLAGFDPRLEEAAMDLGSSYWGTLLRVTLPLSAPALAAGFLSSFTTSFDEFALAYFLAGTDATLPVYLYGQLRYPSRLPVIVSLAALLMVSSVVLVVFTEWLRRVGQR